MIDKKHHQRLMLEQKVRGLAATLGDTELEVLGLLGDRLKMGQGQYGKLKERHLDNRRMYTETLQEVLDAMIYPAIDLVALDKFDIEFKLKEEGGDDEPGKRDCEVKEAFGCRGNGKCGDTRCHGKGGSSEGYQVAGMLVVGDGGADCDDGSDRQDGGEADETNRRTVESGCTDWSDLADQMFAGR